MMEMTVAWKRQMRSALIEERRELCRLAAEARAKGDKVAKKCITLLCTAAHKAINCLAVTCVDCGVTVRSDSVNDQPKCFKCLTDKEKVPEQICQCGKPKQKRNEVCLDCRRVCKCGKPKRPNSKTCISCFDRVLSPIVTVACSVCGNEYQKKQNVVKATCSDACSKEAKRRSANRAARLGAKAVRDKAAPLRMQRLLEQVENQARKVRVCWCCLSKPITNGYVCSDCRKVVDSFRRKTQRNRKEKVCIICSSVFTNRTSQSSKLCSDQCKHEHARATGVLSAQRARSRARRASLEVSQKVGNVNPLTVFIRDGWCCAYCGTSVRQYEANGYLAGDEATLDHVKPLSIGGEHSYDNIVTACWNCNTKKLDSFYAE
jgi:hypothetical protein